MIGGEGGSYVVGERKRGERRSNELPCKHLVLFYLQHTMLFIFVNKFSFLASLFSSEHSQSSFSSPLRSSTTLDKFAYTILHFTTLHFSILHYTALHYTQLHYTVLLARLPRSYRFNPSPKAIVLAVNFAL